MSALWSTRPPSRVYAAYNTSFQTITKSGHESTAVGKLHSHKGEVSPRIKQVGRNRVLEDMKGPPFRW